MFDPEFYPTPLSVIEMMGIDCYNKVALEPSAGSGNIVDWLTANGAARVLACEKHPKLRAMLRGCELISDDFLKVTDQETASVELIVMNPPFSNAATHIMHAWDIAPEGCEVIALCNYETVNKGHYGSDRRELSSVIESYGEALNIGDVFTEAERKTGIEIGLIRLFKPVLSEGMDMDGFYLQGDEEIQGDAVIGYNEIKAVVNTYLAAVRCFGKVEAIANELKAYTNVTFVGEPKISEDGKIIPVTYSLNFGTGISFEASYNEKQIATKEGFARAFQRKCWQYIFDRVGIQKYVTSGVMKDVTKFIESRVNYPFTMRNIGRMLDIIVGTRSQTMERAIVEAVDNFTRHTHDNRHGVEGWKTNDTYLLTKKFITGWISEKDYGGRGLSIKWHNSNWDQIEDLTKALCFVTGSSYDKIPSIRDIGKLTPNTWYEWGFFEFKVFLKGSGHFKFKKEDDWARLNQAYAKAKGLVLPEKMKA